MSNLRPVIFGEVLFDSFPDGRQVLGGAPFNVAWHLRGFGLDPLMISRVGDDARGREVLQAMGNWEMDSSGVQVEKAHPTGAVSVSLKAGQPHYDILPDQAYDHIDADAAVAVVGSSDVALVYHGSLATRTAQSRQALSQLLAAVEAPVFLDVNLRAPWWSREQVAAQIQRATWVKINDDELVLLSDSRMVTDLTGLARQFFQAHPRMQQLIVTRGARGALVVHAEGVSEGAPVPVEDVVDTVGAGDAFAAVMITGIIRQWPLAESLAHALRFAASICRQRGATQLNPGLYQAQFPQ